MLVWRTGDLHACKRSACVESLHAAWVRALTPPGLRRMPEHRDASRRDHAISRPRAVKDLSQDNPRRRSLEGLSSTEKGGAPCAVLPRGSEHIYTGIYRCCTSIACGSFVFISPVLDLVQSLASGRNLNISRVHRLPGRPEKLRSSHYSVKRWSGVSL